MKHTLSMTFTNPASAFICCPKFFFSSKIFLEGLIPIVLGVGEEDMLSVPKYTGLVYLFRVE